MEDKSTFMRALFTDIADTYDLLNHLLSFRRDIAWRRHAASQCDAQGTELVLDVATGTGELALEIAKRGKKVIGIDICPGMLAKAKKKGSNNVTLALAKAESLPFPDNTFDCATIGFALRNVTDISQTILEMVRVVKTGGKLIFLEFSQPQNRAFNALYRFYLFHILPLLGTLISRKKYAYQYFPCSIAEFLSPAELKKIMEENGLKNLQIKPLSWGIVTVYIGVKA